MVKMKEIAAKAGVSQATVSLVLGNHPLSQRLSEKTRQKVLKAAADLKYRKNAVAQAMVTGKNSIVAFGAWNLSNWHHAVTLEGTMNALEEEGFLTKMFSFQKNTEFNRKALETMIEHRVSGLICVNPPMEMIEALQTECEPYKIPVVYMHDDIESRYWPMVFSDDAMGMRLAVDHLFSLGHKEFAFVGYRGDETLNPYTTRFKSAQAHIKELGLNLAPENIFKGQGIEVDENIIDYSTAAADQIARRENRPTAVLCVTDPIAAIVINRLRLHNIHTPLDISVVGFSDNALCKFMDPPITTIHQPFYGMGQKAAEILMEIIHSDNDVSKVERRSLLPVNLVARGSTGPLRR